MAPVRSYTNWNKRTTDEKTQAEDYKFQKENNEKRYGDRKLKFPKWINAFVINQIIQIFLGIMIALLIVFFPVKFTNSKAIQVMIVGIKIIVMSIMMIKKIRTEPLASLSIISLVGFGIWLWSLTISQKTLLKMVTGTAWEFQYIFFMFICCMVAIWVWLSLWGVKKYSNKKKREKIKFVICVCLEYVIIVGVVISVYANLYVAYHNNVYFAFQMNLLEMQGENVSLHRKKIEKKIDGKTWSVNGNYDEQDKEKLCPLDIMIQNKNGKIGIIEPDLNIALNEDNMGSANNEKYIYFSFVSFFSSGYGDIYPILSITRNWAVQEMIISHMIMVVLIPILLTSVQEFIQKQEPEVK